jgi:hypothetical protein
MWEDKVTYVKRSRLEIARLGCFGLKLGRVVSLYQHGNELASSNVVK